MGVGRFLKKIGTSLLAGLGGAAIGAIVLALYCFMVWLPANSQKAGLGIIALLPVMLILFSLMGIVIGGIAGIVVYLIVKSAKN